MVVNGKEKPLSPPCPPELASAQRSLSLSATCLLLLRPLAFSCPYLQRTNASSTLRLPVPVSASSTRLGVRHGRRRTGRTESDLSLLGTGDGAREGRARHFVLV
jgi:hypothetical protein